MAFALSFIWLFTLLLPLVLSLEQPFDVTKISDGVHVDRHFSLSTKGPTTAAIRRSPELRRRSAPGFELFETLADVMDNRKANNDSDACNLREVRWIRATRNHIRVRQVGEVSDICNTRVVLNDAATNNKMDPGYVSRVKDIIIDVKDALFQAQKDIPELPDKNYPALNWTRGAYALRNWELKRSGQTCTSDNLFAYRKNGVWYMRAGMTNNPVDAFVADYTRQTIDEYIPKDFSDPMRLLHVKYLNKDDLIENGTTLINRFSGTVALASVSNMVFDENPALVEALRLNALAVDQAEDAVTPSNIAILALPMVMSLIPVAFLADLNTCAMLWYIVFTDVFSALPFLIKGIELFDSTTIKRGEAVAYHIGNKTLGQMEVWAAECRGEDSFRVLGIIFICIALFSITFGVLLEIVAAIIMRRRRITKRHEASGPFGKAIFDSTAYAPLGSAKEDERDRRLSAELEEEARYSYEQARWRQSLGGPGAMGDDTTGDAPRTNEEEGVESSEPSHWWMPLRRSSQNRHVQDDRAANERDGDDAPIQVPLGALTNSQREYWDESFDNKGGASTAPGGSGV